MKLIIEGVHSAPYELEVNTVQDLEDLIPMYPQIRQFLNTENVEQAAENVCKYLSNHQLSAHIDRSPDEIDELYNPNHMESNPDGLTDKLSKLRHTLEEKQKYHEVEIPEHLVLKHATHRWGQ